MGEHLIWVGYTISYPTRVYGIVELLNNGVGTYQVRFKSQFFFKSMQPEVSVTSDRQNGKT